MQPHHDGAAGRPRCGTRPDIEVQTVLAETRLVAIVERVGGNRGLAAGRPVSDRVTYPGPALHGPGRPPAQVSPRGGRVRDAQEATHPTIVAGDAAQTPR